jgi:UTP-glucose-1-phosphate uridylyltransferase
MPVKKVTKAVIVAAGLAKRMFPFTKIDSKLLIPILNKPIALYLMEELRASGIKEVVIVTNHASKLRDFFTEDKELDNILEKIERSDLVRELHRIESLAKISYVPQEEPRGWLHALMQAKDYIKNEPFVVLFSDCLYKSAVPATRQVINAFNKYNKNIISTARFVFKPAIFKLARNIEFQLGDETSDSILINKLRERKETCEYHIKGQFYDVGDPIQLLRTLLAFTLEDWYYSRKLKEIMLKDINLKKDFENFYNQIK